MVEVAILHGFGFLYRPMSAHGSSWRSDAMHSRHHCKIGKQFNVEGWVTLKDQHTTLPFPDRFPILQCEREALLPDNRTIQPTVI